MTRVLVAAVSAALLIGAVVSPANAGHGGGGSRRCCLSVVAAFTAANTFTRHFAAVDFTRAFMASAFMVTTTF